MEINFWENWSPKRYYLLNLWILYIKEINFVKIKFKSKVQNFIFLNYSQGF